MFIYNKLKVQYIKYYLPLLSGKKNTLNNIYIFKLYFIEFIYDKNDNNFFFNFFSNY